MRSVVCSLFLAFSSLSGPSWTICSALAGENPNSETPAQRGYRWLTTKAYLPPDFDQQTFDEAWKTWEEPLRSQAAKATPDERRQLAYSRYGLTSAPGDASGKPQQYVVDAAGNWMMNCLACHQGKVAGKVVPGAPNSLYALETLTEEIRATKFRLRKKLTRMDLGSLVMPLGTSNGATNAVMFGVVLMSRRDPDLNVLPAAAPPPMTHHDHDAPAWWLLKRKQYIYSDGFAFKSHRALMQFMLVKENGPARFREWESDYQDVLAWIESLEAPRYRFEVDPALAARGEAVFRDHCASCHGTYGKHPSYPNKIVPIKEVGTDPVRLSALSVKHRESYAKSWFAHYGQEQTILNPGGYNAPPLDGIWATAPYLHNGSVPTLWHLLHPDQRPKVWLRAEDGYDTAKVGLEVEAFDKLPAGITRASQRRRYFDSSGFGKSAVGHPFAEELDEEEKRAVLEYLKTL